MALKQDEVVTLLSQLDQHAGLSIIKLSEPILAQDAAGGLQAQEQNSLTQLPTQRGSDVSSGDSNDHPTPASLQADLEHYKELFTKLRFSYVEQVTKEKFLRFVVGDPPFYVTAAENAELESRLASEKEALKAQKLLVANMIAELEQQARYLSSQNQHLKLQKEQLRSLPEQMEQFQRAIADLAAAQEPLADNPVLGLPLHDTLDILSHKEDELAELETRLAILEDAQARKSDQLTNLELELRPLIAQKNSTVNAAKEARQRKVQQTSGGAGDELEERGRWLTAVEATMTNLLSVDA